MNPPRKQIAIPIVEAGTNRVAGSFCSTQDALTQQELEALEQIRSLQQQAREIKKRLKAVAETEKTALQTQLDELRIQARYWQDRRRVATLEKNIAIGHAPLPIKELT